MFRKGQEMCLLAGTLSAYEEAGTDTTQCDTVRFCPPQVKRLMDDNGIFPLKSEGHHMVIKSAVPTSQKTHPRHYKVNTIQGISHFLL
jgi:hypothetical protein